MNLLNLSQQQPRLRRELSRRIGYTNGLHDIFRFSRIVTYLHQIAPASGAALRSVVLDKENVQGRKYADGVIEVAGALGLIAKVGMKLMLNDRGYALYAINQMDTPVVAGKALLLNAIIESDGDATLNLLDLIANSTPSEALGPQLVERLLKIIHIREDWARSNISGKLARDLVLQDLSEVKARLQQAINLDRKQSQSFSSYRHATTLGPEQKLARFYNHTVQPRRGWLRDLGCIEQNNGGPYKATPNALRLLALLRESSYYRESIFVSPFSVEISALLGVVEVKNTDDLHWQAIASLFIDQPSSSNLSSIEYFQLIKSVYPHVKLHVFNEATVESVFYAIAARLATKGMYLERSKFDGHLDSICSEFPDSIYRLQQRQGGTGYIALKANIDW